MERNQTKQMLEAGTGWQPLARDTQGHPCEQSLMGRGFGALRLGDLFTFSCPDLLGALLAVFSRSQTSLLVSHGTKGQEVLKCLEPLWPRFSGCILWWTLLIIGSIDGKLNPSGYWRCENKENKNTENFLQLFLEKAWHLFRRNILLSHLRWTSVILKPPSSHRRCSTSCEARDGGAIFVASNKS